MGGFYMGPSVHVGLTGDTEGWNWLVPGVGFVPLVLGLCARVVVPLDATIFLWELWNGYLWCVIAAMALIWTMVMRCNDNLIIMQAVTEDKLCTSAERLVLVQGTWQQRRVNDTFRSERVDSECVVYPTKLCLPEPTLLPS